MKRIKVFLIDFIISAVVLLLIGLAFTQRRPYVPEHHIVRDTIFDTITFRRPIPVDSVVIRYVTVNLPIESDSSNTDTTTVPDSIKTIIPITQKEYKNSLYHAWVSGYMPSLDSIHVRSIIQKETIYKPTKPKRWGIGLQLGGGFTFHNGRYYPAPYIGIGIHYNIFSW